MRMQCVGIAFGMLIASSAAGETRPPPDPGAIIWCVAEYMRVDGLPLVKHAWCTTTADGRLILLATDEGEQQVFGIRPANGPRPPIPKVYKRLE